jgi:hypothetical protein
MIRKLFAVAVLTAFTVTCSAAAFAGEGNKPGPAEGQKGGKFGDRGGFGPGGKGKPGAGKAEEGKKRFGDRGGFKGRGGRPDGGSKPEAK